MTGEDHPLEKALEIQQRAAGLGFDWPDAQGPRAKIDEELAELDAAGNDCERRGELGDLLFAVVNHARHLGVEPAEALCATNEKFKRRFGHIEETLSVRGLLPSDMELEHLDTLWDEAKRLENDQGEPG